MQVESEQCLCLESFGSLAEQGCAGIWGIPACNPSKNSTPSADGENPGPGGSVLLAEGVALPEYQEGSN